MYVNTESGVIIAYVFRQAYLEFDTDPFDIKCFSRGIKSYVGVSQV